MKYKLNKAEFEALTEEQQKEYTLDGDVATLNIEGEGAPTAEALAKADKKREIEAEHRKKAETRAKEAEDRAEKLQSDLEAAGGDSKKLEKLKADHAAEIQRLRDEREAETKKAREDRDNALINETATKFANDRFTIPGLIADQFAKRLSVEEVNGEPVVRVISEDGKPSTASLADLEKEFLDNKDFSPIIRAKTGSGGGAAPGKGGGAPLQKKLSEMTATEEAAFERDHPTEYAAAVEAETA